MTTTNIILVFIILFFPVLFADAISSDVVSDTPDMSTHGELFRFHSASLNCDTLNYVFFFIVYMPIFINSLCIPLPCRNISLIYC